MADVVTAEEAHVVVVAVLQRPRLVDILAYQPKSHITLDHLLKTFQGLVWLLLRATLDVPGLITEDKANLT